MENKPRTKEDIEKEEQEQLAILENARKDAEVLLAKKNKAKSEESAPEIEKTIKTTGAVETLDEKIERLGREIQTGTEDLEKTDDKITQIGNKLEELNKRSGEIDNKLEELNKRSGEIENRIKVEQDKIEKVNIRIAEIEEQLKILLKEPEKIELETIIKEETETEGQSYITPQEMFEEVEKIAEPTTKKTEAEKIVEEKKQTEPIIKEELKTAEQTVENVIINEKEKKMEQELEQSLTPKEKQIVQNEMKKSTPELFEPEEVKKNMGLFLRNLVVKSVSGIKFKIPENLKKIAGKLRGKTLLGVAIIGLFTATSSKDGTVSYAIPDKNIDGSKNTVSVISQEEMQKKELQRYLDAFHIKDYEQLEQIKEDLGVKEFNQLEKTANAIDTSLYNKLTPDGRKDYLYILTDTNHIKNEKVSYIIDKPTSTIYAIAPDGKEIGSCLMILGATRGELPNIADPNLEKLKSRYEQTTTTPAGRYEVGYSYYNEEDSATYGGKILHIFGSDCLGLHVVWPEEYEARMAAINTPTLDDNRMSWGCGNVPNSFWDGCINPYIERNSRYTLFITPDYQDVTTLNPRTGEVEQISTTTGVKNIKYDYKSKI